jgi:hypothetical protein
MVWNQRPEWHCEWLVRLVRLVRSIWIIWLERVVRTKRTQWLERMVRMDRLVGLERTIRNIWTKRMVRLGH